MATKQTKSSWSDLDLSGNPMLARLASIGSHALQSGKVSPEQAQGIAEQMGVGKKTGQEDSSGLPGQPPVAAMGMDSPEALSMSKGKDVAYNPVSMGVDPDAAQSPLSMTAADMYKDTGMADIGDKKGAKVESVRQDNSTYKRSNNRFLTKPMDQTRAEQMMAQGIYPNVKSYEAATDENGNPQFDKMGNPVLDKDRPIYDFDNTQIDESNPVRQQQAGLSRMEDILKMQAGYEKDKNHMDFSPLAALSDALNAQKGHPTNLAASFQKPENGNEAFMKYADEIQKRKADIQKAITEGVKAQKGGTTMDMLTQALLAKDVAGQANPTRDFAQQQQTRLDFQAHQQTVRAIRNDKNLRDKLVQYQNLGNALSNLTNADHMTPQQFDEAQQAIRANLGIKGSSGVGERERTQMNSLGISADRISQILSSKPTDINAPEMVDHIKNLAGLETRNIKNQYADRLNAVSQGNASMYARNPDLKSDLESMIGANQNQVAAPAPMGKKNPGAQNQAQKAAAATAKPMSIDDFFKGGGH